MIYIYLIIGLALLLAGANYLVESSVAIARRARLSNFVIGLTIVGMGDIGSNFGRRLKAMGASVCGVRRTEQPKPDWCDRVYTIDRLQEAVRDADVVALCLPGTGSTRHILNREVLDAMKQGAYIINVGRGTAVEQELFCQSGFACVRMGYDAENSSCLYFL